MTTPPPHPAPARHGTPTPPGVGVATPRSLPPSIHQGTSRPQRRAGRAVGARWGRWAMGAVLGLALLPACEPEMSWRAVKQRYCLRYQTFAENPPAHDATFVRDALVRRAKGLREQRDGSTEAGDGRPLDAGCAFSASWSRRVQLQAAQDARDAAWIRSGAPTAEDWGAPPVPLDLTTLPTACALPTRRSELEAELVRIEAQIAAIDAIEPHIGAWYARELEVCLANGYEKVDFVPPSAREERSR